MASLVRGQTVACAHYLVPVEAGRAGHWAVQQAVSSHEWLVCAAAGGWL